MTKVTKVTVILLYFTTVEKKNFKRKKINSIKKNLKGGLILSLLSLIGKRQFISVGCAVTKLFLCF